MTYVLENDGTITRRPYCVARGMLARKEAVKLLSDADAGKIKSQRTTAQADKRTQSRRDGGPSIQ
jgi:hypothetical protein